MLGSIAMMGVCGGAARAATFTVNTTSDVTNSSDGLTTLREAIVAANVNADADTIAFNIAGTGPFTIAPTTALPTITKPVTIDGYTQPGTSVNTLSAGSNAVLRIEISGAELTKTTLDAPALAIAAATSTVRGLVFNRFDNDSIRLMGGNSVVQGCFIGTNVAGTARATTTIYNSNRGMTLSSAGNLIGGLAPAERNVISGNGNAAIVITGTTAFNNRVQGNIIGLNALGTGSISNRFEGVTILAGAHDTLVGGTQAEARNLIAANSTGVAIGGTGSNNNRVQGNYFGTDAAGTRFFGNTVNGVDINGGAQNNLIGGLEAGARNVIGATGSANTTYATITGNGVVMRGTGTDNNTVQGNYIGANATGTGGLGNNARGVCIAQGAQNNLIGGTSEAARNIISGQSGTAGTGVLLDGTGTSNNLVQGNSIGLNTAGAALGNIIGLSIRLGASNNLIGGTTPEAANLIAFSSADGITVAGDNTTSGNRILRNLIFSNGAGFGGQNIDLSASYNQNLSGDGVTPNDASDADSGANTLQNFPVITALTRSNGSILVSGPLDTSANADFLIELYQTPSSVTAGTPGTQFLGSTTVTTDANGHATWRFSVPDTPDSTLFSATATGAGGTSEYGPGSSIANQAPVNSVFSGFNGFEDSPVLFNAQNNFVFKVSDVDAGDAPLTVELRPINGRITFNTSPTSNGSSGGFSNGTTPGGDLSGVTFLSGSSPTSAVKRFSGSQTAINAALRNLTFTPIKDTQVTLR